MRRNDKACLGLAKVDLSRICAAPSAGLDHLAFEGQMAFAAQCCVPTAGVIEAVDVLE